ncbi:MAG: DNA mismatch repair endonuclease MutL [Ignavibacteriota bacterium]|nr:DNA mismatch repair endonuclease MutL [Ignavibacteriota bacterium]MCO6446728.1 DNA mismatch repair endonuclease MutL [Ignavibacterium album]MCZ2268156.1 DNA mismatch repair endonuclease MutL [Ignavibacteriales bacterium]QKJ98882.1 MAG: DNA mismatch repair endonuclease MutL [Ignavibacteriota bacterium]HOJ07197.1 DNA mismatch repair endonuclease MutL [Ignavibacteriaceae bacterium]
MTSRIKILPENIANKIAAGEVVQRPESVVKELLENAVDAKATNIVLIIKQAGKSLIQVCDNGSGMTEEEAVLSIRKHATSKITSIEDLESINTLGFRGEALSSIAAVCQLEIKTETADEETGTLIKIENENEIVTERISTAKGTCVSVKNIFYNIPVRRKFLKSDTTELKHIIDTFNRTALAYPEINFKFYNSDNLVFDYKEGSLDDRIQQVFADNMLEALIPVDEETDYLSVKGYIGKPSIFKKSKGEQFLFLNKRFVFNKSINHAVFTAFENILEKGDYPFFILFISLNPSKVDVNIHPSKLEVKFDDEKDIYNFILSVVRKSIATHDLVPTMSFSGSEDGNEKLDFNPFQPLRQNDFSDRPSFTSRERKERTTVTDEEIDLVFGDLKKNILTDSLSGLSARSETDELETDKESKVEKSASSEPDTTFLIQLHNKYILSQIKSGLMIIDQHVAHERILYEKALSRLDANLPFSQQLLFPIKLQFDLASYEILKELDQMISKLGFKLKYLPKNYVLIEGVPDDIKSGSEEKILKEFISEYLTNQTEKHLEEKDNIAKSYSCKAAIKAGDRLSEKEMRLLIDQLFATSMPYVCPHGRPIVIKISLEEFDRRFGRTS